MQPCTIVGLDFDMTIADTFEPPPTGLGVPEAYQQAITDIFGGQTWQDLPAFANQAPIELGKMLRKSIGSSRLVAAAQAYYAAHAEELNSVMPLRNGTAIDWRVDDPLNSVVEVLVRRKLQLLLPNVGTLRTGGGRWPRLMQGFAAFWRRTCADPSVATVIISSGHDVFIERVLEIYALPRPNVLISDDYMRRRGLQLYKPDPTIWEWVLVEVRALGFRPRSSLYIGDSRQQDGALAQHARIDFVHFAEEGSLWHGHIGTIDRWGSDWTRLVTAAYDRGS